MRKIKELKSDKGTARVFFEPEWEEYIVMFYAPDGCHIFNADAHEDDKQAAIDTAQAGLDKLVVTDTDGFMVDECKPGEKIKFRAYDYDYGRERTETRVIQQLCRCGKTFRGYVVVKYKGDQYYRVYADMIIREPAPAPVDYKKMSDVSRREFAGHSLDYWVDYCSAFRSFHELVEAKGGYRPSLDVSDDKRRFIADCYDEYQDARGDSRRAYRYGDEPVYVPCPECQESVRADDFGEGWAASCPFCKSNLVAQEQASGNFAVEKILDAEYFERPNGVWLSTGDRQNATWILERAGSWYEPAPGWGKFPDGVMARAWAWLERRLDNRASLTFDDEKDAHLVPLGVVFRVRNRERKFGQYCFKAKHGLESFKKQADALSFAREYRAHFLYPQTEQVNT